MADFIALAALVVSIVTTVFVVVTSGLGLALEYRESETTSKRKKDVDEKLKDDLKVRLKQFSEASQGFNHMAKHFFMALQLKNRRSSALLFLIFYHRKSSCNMRFESHG